MELVAVSNVSFLYIGWRPLCYGRLEVHCVKGGGGGLGRKLLSDFIAALMWLLIVPYNSSVRYVIEILSHTHIPNTHTYTLTHTHWLGQPHKL